jgi:hypothetical protein
MRPRTPGLVVVLARHIAQPPVTAHAESGAVLVGRLGRAVYGNGRARKTSRVRGPQEPMAKATNVRQDSRKETHI